MEFGLSKSVPSSKYWRTVVITWNWDWIIPQTALELQKMRKNYGGCALKLNLNLRQKIHGQTSAKTRFCELSPTGSSTVQAVPCSFFMARARPIFTCCWKGILRSCLCMRATFCCAFHNLPVMLGLDSAAGQDNVCKTNWLVPGAKTKHLLKAKLVRPNSHVCADHLFAPCKFDESWTKVIRTDKGGSQNTEWTVWSWAGTEDLFVHHDHSVL